jgi:sterol desaturase/sphingolipid hydroxylase (fatty acid hydroxylase superfamily)
VVAALIAGTLAVDPSPVLVGAFVFLLVVPFEKLFPRHRGQPLRRAQVGTDLAYLLVTPLLNVVTITVAVVVGVASLAWLPGLALRPLVALVPASVAPLLGVALFDFAIYWVHRWSHEVPLMWRFHAIHHSTQYLDWVSGFRIHPLDGALLAPPFVFLLAAGFSPEYTGVLAAVQIVTGIFLHANVRWRWRPLHRVVITPEFHHWHHTAERNAIHSNYSVFLPLWDQLFGTYHMPRDRRPEHYGIDEPMPRGIMAQLRYPLRGLGSPWRLVRHPLRSTRRLAAGIRLLLGQIWRSTTRPTRPIRTRPTCARPA